MFKEIRYFLEVANCLSFTGAADRLVTTQQAVSRQVSKLEDELGVKLLNRTTRSVSLTEAGILCREEFSNVMDNLEKAVMKVQNAGLANTSSVTIGFYVFFSRPMIITPIMESLYAKFPDVQFNIRLFDFGVLRQQLLDGNIDLCVALSSDWQYWPFVKVIPLMKQPFKIVVSIKHPLAAHAELDLNELSEYNWIAFDNLDNIRPYPQPWLRKVPCKNKMPVGDFTAVLANVEACQGFCCVPPVFEGVNSNKLKYYPVPYENACVDFICAHRDDMLNPKVIAVTKYIQRHFEPVLNKGI